MKIFDCFMYFDEDLVLDLRFNYLSKFVDNFVIVESKFNHKGEERKLEFDLNRFDKFKDKIIYIALDKNPESIEKIKDNDSEIEKNNKFINNSNKRERFQRNQILNGLVNAEGNDWVIISDVDEIPNLENINFGKLKKGGFHLAKNTNTNILPIVTKGLFNIKPKNRWTIKPGLININICEPIYTAEKTVNELISQMENVFLNQSK